LGAEVSDPQHVESSQERLPGLNLLATRTVFSSEKTVTRSRAEVVGGHGFWRALNGRTLEGYEIHMGQTDADAPLLHIVAREGAAVSALDGACSADGTVFGAYLHGWFENDAFRRAWLESLGAQPAGQAFADYRASAYDRLADVLASSLDLGRLDQIVEQGLRP
jgi:adenosylcobyric acid synthase